MRIIEMCRLTENGEDIDVKDTNAPDPRDWWCVIETKTEEDLYEMVWTDNSASLIPLWNKLVNNAGRGMGLHWGDDDIYGYIRPDEEYPEVGEEFIDGDGDKWTRVA